MKWYKTDRLLPGEDIGYVIARALNADYCQFIYQAMYINGQWEFWDEEYWPDDRKKRDPLKVTHWAFLPEFEDGGF